MIEEYAEPTRAIGSHPTTDNGAGQGDRLAVLLLQGEQTGPVSSSILAGEVADPEPLDPHRHGVGVIGVVGLGDQDGVHLQPHPIVRGAMTANDAPQVVLIAGLAHDLEVLAAVVQLDLHARAHPAGPLLRLQPDRRSGCCWPPPSSRRRKPNGLSSSLGREPRHDRHSDKRRYLLIRY